MNSAHASSVHSPGAGLASWYTPGRSDGFGDRLLMFDNTDAVSLELLRFRRELAVAPGFENGLRDRVDHLAQFRHPSFPLVRAVVHLDEQDLTLVSAHTPGQRLSELPTGKLRKGLHPAVVTWIIKEITPALAALQSSGRAIAHGALNADRVVLTSGGRLCVVEHSLAAALGRLALTPEVFWRQFGLLAPMDRQGLVRIDPRTDVVQLGAMALSLLLARPVTLHEFERSLPALLDEFSALAAVSPSVFAAPLRAWLERALQLAPHSYESAGDAQEGANELPVPAGPAWALGAAGTGLPSAQTDAADADDAFARETVTVSLRQAGRPLRSQVVRELPGDFQSPRITTPEPGDARGPNGPAARTTRWKRAYTVLIVVTLAAVALGEGAIIARLGTQPTVVSVAPPALAVPSPRPVAPAPPAAPIAATAATAPARDTAAEAAIVQAAARQRSGGLRLSSAIELNVLEGDRVLGSTADGPIVATAGTHEFDLVNAALGYRTRQTVTIRAGVITPLALAPPMGRISVNAQPWAQVLIDDNPIGETPLANVPVALGQHHITFKHPQLGERRETVVVRADTIARVSTSFVR